jgi:hypothetical protein
MTPYRTLLGLGLLTSLVSLTTAWAAGCEHLQQAIEQEERAQQNDVTTGMAGILGGAGMILPNCTGYDCVSSVQRNNMEALNRYNAESARHEGQLRVLRPRLEGCESTMAWLEGILRDARMEQRAQARPH